MARIRTNSAFSSARGRIGDVVIKHYKYGEVLSRRPEMGPYIPSDKQRASNERWKAAAEYYHRVKADPVLSACYAGVVAKKGFPLSAVTMRDFMRAPKVINLDLTKYRGRAGDRLYVDAYDDFRVNAVEFTLRDAGGNVFEFGQAHSWSGFTWRYETQHAAPAGGPVTIEAVAIDLPGNRTSLVQTWTPSTPPAATPAVAIVAAPAPATPAPASPANPTGLSEMLW